MGFTTAHDRPSVTSVDKEFDKVEAIERFEHNKYANIGLSADDAEFFDTFPEEKHKKLIRKVDVRLVPVLALLYLCAHIDRANIGRSSASCYIGTIVADVQRQCQNRRNGW